MAKPADKMDSNEQKEELIKIKEVDKKTLKKLSDELQKLYKYKAKHVINDDGSCTFYPTPNCKPSQKKLQTKPFNMNAAMKYANCNKMESCSMTTQIIPSDTVSSFVTAAITAWSDHYPLRIKPEHIWLTILQSVAVHVDQNAEKLRSYYVTFDGKMDLKVIRNNFVMGSEKNDWGGVIKEFAQQIDKNTVPETAELFECDFSKSTMIEQIATKVTIMDICKNYFKYIVMTMCGFPQITLDGTKKDWISLKKKTEYLLKNKVDNKFGNEWSMKLLPILDRFIVAFDGNIDCVFWNSMIKRGATYGSGAKSYLAGWFNILYPIIDKYENYYCKPYSMDNAYVAQGFSNDGGRGDGPDEKEFPTGLSTAPVLWQYLGKDYNLQFISGFVGFTQNEKTLEICPNIGWCIAHSMNDKELQENKKKQNKWY